MLIRRLFAVLLVFGMLAALTLPALGREKDKDKDKDKDKGKDKDKVTEKDKDKKETTPPGDKVAIKWKLEKDKVFYQKMKTTTNQTMKVMNNDVNQKQEQTFYFSFKVTKVENEKATIEQKIEGVQMNIEIGGSTINYDSTKDTTTNNPLGEFFKALVGTTFTITLNTKDLKVESVDGRDPFIAKLVTANPQMKPLLEVILSADALKEMAEPTFGIAPTKDVAKGEAWTRPSKLDMGPIGKYENTYKYTYRGTEGEKDKQLYMISVEPTLKYTPPGDVAGAGGLPFKIKGAKLESKSPVGQLLFNPSKGRLEKSTVKITLDGNLSIEIGGQATTVTLSQTQESVIESGDATFLPPAKK